MRHRKIRIRPVNPMLAQAGQSSSRPVNVSAVCGEIPVIMVRTSEVAKLTYSPVLRAATASAEAVNTANKRKVQPKRRPKNMFNLLFCFFSLFKIKRIFLKKIKNTRKKWTIGRKNKKNVVFWQ